MVFRLGLIIEKNGKVSSKNQGTSFRYALYSVERKEKDYRRNAGV